MGGPIDMEQKWCELIIHGHDHDLCVTMVQWVNVLNSERGDYKHQHAIEMSSF